MTRRLTRPDYSKEGSVWREGPTALIAAMRCFVRAKLGDEIDLNVKETS